jgi:predicted alpha-1,2-mannosidase
MKLGYVVPRVEDHVSRTLEFAYDDFCVAQLAKAVGKMEDYKLFMKRSQNYRNLYNPPKELMWPKDKNGNWLSKPRGAYCEASPYGYLFCVMQDIPGLVDLMGMEPFERQLDYTFQRMHAHGNEPQHHYAYLYNYIDKAHKTQEAVRRIAVRLYHSQPPGGLCGDDDCGQMSAWLVFSSMGFYPVTPGSQDYAIGSPMWKEVTIHIDKPYKPVTFKIVARNQAPTNCYIQSAELNGKPLPTPFIKHADIISGGELVFEMGPKPGKVWNVPNQ